MLVLWLDTSAGVSGDMLVGALVDVGVPIAHLQQVVDQLGLDVRLTAQEVVRASLRATRVHVDVPTGPPTRTLSDVVRCLAPLDDVLRRSAVEVFARLASAEAAVHGVSPEDVHFHEVGALDAIADIVATLAGVSYLGVDRVHASAVGLGGGRTDSDHGSLPVPAPAVLELARGATVHLGPGPFEAATPTGMALLSNLVTSWDAVPSIVPQRVGHGAGSRDPSDHPNVVRAVVGVEPHDSPAMVAVEANVDDMDPRLLPSVINALLGAGASDAWSTPIHMKKGRPGVTISALVASAHLGAIEDLLFRETTTIGLRMTDVRRATLPRAVGSVDVDGHAVRVKRAWHRGVEVNRSLEWEDVVAVAAQMGRAPKDVLAAAAAAAWGSMGRTSSGEGPAMARDGDEDAGDRTRGERG